MQGSNTVSFSGQIFVNFDNLPRCRLLSRTHCEVKSPSNVFHMTVIDPGKDAYLPKVPANKFEILIY